MKYIHVLFLLCSGFTLQSQIEFEEVTTPNDFSLEAIRQSPAGMYFAQASNDAATIYTSMDGEQWEQEYLPEEIRLDEIQFSEDGTPLLKGYGGRHTIRRTNGWYMLQPGNTWGVDGSFISGDTLFALKGNSCYYSTDTGGNFTPYCTLPEVESTGDTHFWAFDNHFAVYYRQGGETHFAVYNKAGIRLLLEVWDDILTNVSFIHNSCGQLLIHDGDEYHHLSLETGVLSFTSGNTTAIAPAYNYGDDFYSLGGVWFHRNGSQLNRTSACNFNWVTVLEDSELLSYNDHWLSPTGELLMTNENRDHFIEYNIDEEQWQVQTIGIHYPYIFDVNESYQGDQVVNTPNLLSAKNTTDEEWVEALAITNSRCQAQYSNNGDLYLNRKYEILHSNDNGQNFTTINLPDFMNSTFGISDMHLLGEGLLFVYNVIGGAACSLDNGQTWTAVNFSVSPVPTKVALVGDEIFIIKLGLLNTITKINIFTNESSTENLGITGNIYDNLCTIQEDGVVYFLQKDNSQNQTHLYRYEFGANPAIISTLQASYTSGYLYSSGYDLYLFFSAHSYYFFDGQDLVTLNFTFGDLPLSHSNVFKLANSQHLYVVNNANRIFRSTEPLSLPQVINGSVYHEEDQDCLTHSSDEALAGWRVKVEGNNYSRIKSTNSQGDYAFSVPVGNYTLTTYETNAYWELCESSLPVSVTEDNVTVTQDFQAEPLAACASLELDFSTPFLRRCFNNTYTVRVSNTGPLASNGTTVRLVLDPFFEFLSASIPYTQVNSQEIDFDLGVLAVGETIEFQLHFYLTCDAELGELHCLNGLINDAASCPNFQPYDYTECQVNIGSYDPNDKRTFNENGLETESIDLEEYLFYHIRFQNTGTDTAFRVRVVDPLSPVLDVNTLEMLSASHPYEYSVNDGASLEVVFNDILLPDSTTNEAASHGYFKFKIKPLAEYGYGTTIPNQAAIYFDFNEPIITNNAVVLIQNLVGTSSIEELRSFKVFPNPTNDQIAILSDNEDNLEVDEIEIINLLGQSFKREKWVVGEKINVSNLPTGVYQLLLKTNGLLVGRETFIKH